MVSRKRKVSTKYKLKIQKQNYLKLISPDEIVGKKQSTTTHTKELSEFDLTIKYSYTP